MKKITPIGCILILVCGLAFSAQTTDKTDSLAGFVSHSEIENLIAKLRAEELTGAQALFEREGGPYRVYTSYINNRKGAADLHGVDHEIFILVSGSAEMTLGGDITDKALKSENEYRGSIIKGGTTRSVSAGDIISIPSNTAHQMNPGTGHVLYIVVKITGAQ